MAPSPTADATRFIESSRTSPAANTPGTLVSSANGTAGAATRPAVGPQQVVAGDDEPLVVAGDLGAEPLGAGRGPDEDEQPARRHLLGGGVPVGQRQRLEVAVAPPDTTSLRYLTATLGVEVIRSTRYRDIVSASVAADATSTTRQGEAGQVERGLAGQVGRPDDVDVVALGLAGLARVRAVVDAAAGELVQPLASSRR